MKKEVKRYDERVLKKITKFIFYAVSVGAIVLLILSFFLAGNKHKIKLENGLKQDESKYLVYVYDKSDDAKLFKNFFSENLVTFQKFGLTMYMAKYKDNVEDFSASLALYVVEDNKIIESYIGRNRLFEFVNSMIGESN